MSVGFVITFIGLSIRRYIEQTPFKFLESNCVLFTVVDSLIHM
jgi:hypothetical protein